MKAKEWNEIRVSAEAELAAKVRDLRQELFNLRLQQSSSQRLERPSRLREVRRDIARLETLLRERQLKAAK
ncbi:MAG: 50S ribosomal protein L29 [Verrucomicrobia bacterium]|nr:50S ribosomal protein L29 [Verrucomicrobiota bacterium]